MSIRRPRDVRRGGHAAALCRRRLVQVCKTVAAIERTELEVHQTQLVAARAENVVVKFRHGRWQRLGCGLKKDGAGRIGVKRNQTLQVPFAHCGRVCEAPHRRRRWPNGAPPRARPTAVSDSARSKQPLVGANVPRHLRPPPPWQLQLLLQRQPHQPWLTPKTLAFWKSKCEFSAGRGNSRQIILHIIQHNLRACVRRLAAHLVIQLVALHAQRLRAFGALQHHSSISADQRFLLKQPNQLT